MCLRVAKWRSLGNSGRYYGDTSGQESTLCAKITQLSTVRLSSRTQLIVLRRGAAPGCE